jgi:hypothetical protein
MKKNKIISFPSAYEIRRTLRVNFEVWLDEMFGTDISGRTFWSESEVTLNEPALLPPKTTASVVVVAPARRSKRDLRFTEAEVMGSVPKVAYADNSATVLNEIKRHPGLRSEQIAKNLGLKPKDVSKVLKALREEKRVSVKGKRRGTMYSARG